MELAEFGAMDADGLRRHVFGRGRPAVLRGLVAHWPAVACARQSLEAVAGYLLARDSGIPIDALLLPASERGRLFYKSGMDGFNFARRQLPLSAVIEQLARYSAFADPPAAAVQSALISRCLPRFKDENRLNALDDVEPRIWIGNRIVTPAHFDESDNIACVVAGRRRFTLFAPEQVGNLYIGPLDYAPTPTPISMVDFDAPDLVRYPRFAHALQAAITVDLAPGDALYIPPLWWHHVRSLDVFNVLVNYWWRSAAQAERTPMQAMIYAMQALRNLPPEQRAAWSAMFAHYVFDPHDPGAHLPPQRHGVLSGVRPELPKDS